MGKIVFIDVDGTLVDYENRIPRSAVTAIQEARAKGHRIYICTGRSKAEMSEELWGIGFDGMIGGNGSYVEDHGTTVLHRSLSLEQCRHIVDWLHERKLEFYLESNNGLFGSEYFAGEAEPAIREYSRRKGHRDGATVADIFPDMIFDGELYREDVNKVSYLLNRYEDFLETRAHFPDMEHGTWGGAGETALFGDISVKGITKGNAVLQLLEHLGADTKDTIAFGDAKIDISMLECCEIGVAMGNGGKEIKEMADFITDDVEKDGLYKAFVMLGLV